MKIGWGWKITILYCSFVIMMLTLVIGTHYQHFDLVTKNYYQAELHYQNIINASKNQAALSSPMLVHADAKNITIDFPKEFRNKKLTGNIDFYAPVNAKYDRNFKIDAKNNCVTIARSAFEKTKYVVKINCTVDGKDYYQQSELQLRS